ncbi:MAG: hypothetical protein M1829_000208 [Trizodia sp. TS-e1964]|nr:MAG: hypothetical protein M1829_000208 [Trizodia sp. TS-e1964]
MPSFGGHNATARIRRSKSSNSVKRASNSRVESFDPEVARQHAVAAASHAYGHHFGRTEGQSGSLHTSESDQQYEKVLRRRQSVRFIGPTAVPPWPFPRTEAMRPRKRNSMPSSGELIVPERDPFFEKENTPIGVHSNGRFEPHMTNEDDIASRPSSFEKLRKSKSMLGARTSMYSSSEESRPLKAPKSMSFLRHGLQDRTNRDEYVQQLEQQRLREQASFKRPVKYLRKTVRTSSQIPPQPAIASANQELPPLSKGNKVNLKGKARKISSSIKSRIKRVFQRPKDEEIPDQHIVASRAHFGDYENPLLNLEHHITPAPESDGEAPSRVPSKGRGAASLRIVASNPQMVSRHGSINSLRSEANGTSHSTSRVASWTNSTAANTLTARAAEKKRLSVIQESGGPHVPSSTHRNDYTAFNRPLHMGSAVDSRRVYSALMRKLEETGESSLSEDVAGEELDLDMVKITSRRNSTASQRAEINASDPSAAMSGSPAPRNYPAGAAPLSFLQHDPMAVTGNHAGRRYSGRSQHAELSRRSSQEFGLFRAEFQFGGSQVLTPQQIADRNESAEATTQSRRARGLRESRSSFFPYSTEIRPITPSPYRKALASSAASSEYVATSVTERYPILQREQSVQISEPSHKAQSVSGSVSYYSESIGRGVTGSTISLAKADDTGSAIIITNDCYPREYSYGSDGNSLKLAHEREKAQMDRGDAGERLDEKTGIAWPLGSSQGGIAQSPGIARRKSSELVSPATSLVKRPALRVHHSMDSMHSSPYQIPQRTSSALGMRGRGRGSESPVSAALTSSTEALSARGDDGRLVLGHVLHYTADALTVVGRYPSHMGRLPLAPRPTSPPNIPPLDEPSALRRFGSFARARSVSLSKGRDENVQLPLPEPAREKEQGKTGGGQRMLDLFLSSRRARMRMSEDSGTNAFL